MLYLLPTVQPPPRGVWGEGGVTTLTSMESYLGQRLPAEPPVRSVDDLVRRALGAIGPAGVMDVQSWSRLTRLREVFDRLEPSLRRFRGEDGAELYDLPRAPRPDPDTPAPVRFLPEYDNLLLSHADRRRVNPGGRAIPLFPGNGAQRGTFLVDGLHSGHWQVRRSRLAGRGRERPVRAELGLEPFTRLQRPGRGRADRRGTGPAGLRRARRGAARGPRASADLTPSRCGCSASAVTVAWCRPIASGMPPSCSG